MRLIKRAARQRLTADLQTALDLISSPIVIAKFGPDQAEAMQAFSEKRDGDRRGYWCTACPRPDSSVG